MPIASGRKIWIGLSVAIMAAAFGWAVACSLSVPLAEDPLENPPPAPALRPVGTLPPDGGRQGMA